MKVHLLSSEQIAALSALNTTSVLFVGCDYGAGPCVGEHDLDHEDFASHKALLDSWELPLVEVEFPEYL